MPLKPLHACNFINCKEITSQRFCPAHEKLTKQKYDRERKAEIGQPYATSQHRKWRMMILNRDPICKVCNVAYATEADHIDGNRENRAIENGQGLCRSCHSRKTMKEQGGWGNEKDMQKSSM